MRKSMDQTYFGGCAGGGSGGGVLGASQGTQTDPLVTMSYINE
jgi:hypothetical protein